MSGGNRRGRAVALLAIGFGVGAIVFATPAVGHVGGKANHLWSHLRPKADARYVNVTEKAQRAADADHAAEADHAASADTALTANSANTADTANSATSASNAATAAQAGNANLLDGIDSTAFLRGGATTVYAKSIDTDGSANGAMTCPDGDLCLAAVFCETNDVMLAGGFAEIDGGTRLVMSEPFAPNPTDAWRVGWVNNGTEDTVKVWVLCFNNA
jgi:hypothetical protein